MYKVKYNADGSINRYKVAPKVPQMHDIDYNEAFTPVTKMTIIHVLLAVAATKGWHLHQTDVNNACLRGELDKQVYMLQPPDFSPR